MPAICLPHQHGVIQLSALLNGKKSKLAGLFFTLPPKVERPLKAGRLGSILRRVKPQTLKLVSAVTLAKRSAIKCSAGDEMNRDKKYVSEFLTKFSPGAKGL